MTDSELSRRQAVKAGIAAGTLTMLPRVIRGEEEKAGARFRQEYLGPNVIIVRFGGGVRRRETIDPNHTYSPFLCHDLAKQGTLFRSMEIAEDEGIETGHGQGTLNVLTGKYDKYKDVKEEFLAERFEAQVPTLFEYLRKNFDVPEHQALIVNGEDRTDEEFYTFSNHRKFGYPYRSNVLSLYRFKTFLLRRQIAQDKLSEKELAQKRSQLEKLEALDYRTEGKGQDTEIERFWQRWRAHYGESGLVNPRGDRLLTELTVRAIRQLRPRLVMVNYNDCDYVHWGNLSHYTRAIAIMDLGLQRIVEVVNADPEYRDNTLLVVVPDCGRDNNRFTAVPCQHHFNSRSSREIFGLFVGPDVDRGRVVERRVEQISVTSTIGQLIGCQTEFAEGETLPEVFA